MGVTCDSWAPANHYLFHIANAMIALTFFIPRMRHAVLFLRSLLASASVFFVLWGWLELCSLDTIIWNGVLTVVHLSHLVYLLVAMIPHRFDDVPEAVFSHVFQPVGVSRGQFTPLAKECVEHYYPPAGIYGSEGVTLADQIAVITSGSVLVKKNGQLCHVLRPYEFVDSPEWVCGNGAQPGTHQADLIAGQNGLSVLQWSRKAMVQCLLNDSHLRHIFDSLVGRDIAMKLFKGDQSMLTAIEYQKPPAADTVPHVTNRDISVLYTSTGHKSPQYSDQSMPGPSGWTFST